MFNRETPTGAVMPNPAASLRQHAAAIRAIVSAHHFTNPRIVDYDDPDYDVTLLLEPVGNVSLFDIGRVMADIEKKLALKAFVVTDKDYDATVKRRNFRPPTRPLPESE
ncbi:hypothetical protein [Burkholderia ubonensis]|uniref:hypothetical protein n=1 Tax=Burkholderia ubonensis TaxID=101571 RepID=UPI001FC8DE4D|nr:hypothetical protein [Burkholderia ubonensis]